MLDDIALSLHCYLSHSMDNIYMDQVGLQIMTSVGLRHCRIPGKQKALYAVMWSQNLPHKYCRMKHDSEGKSLPIVRQLAEEEDVSAKTFWQDYGGVVLWRLDACDTDVDRLRRCFAKDVEKLGNQLGSCAKGGMRTGGGLPWGTFALAGESLPELRKAYEATSRVAGHFFDMPRIPAFGAILATRTADGFTAVNLQRENDKVKGAPEVACFNCALLLRPPADGFLQSAVIVNWVPATEKHLRQHLIAALTRSSQSEDGSVLKGPFATPSPRIALGSKSSHERPGKIPTIQSANRFTQRELVKRIQTHCLNYVVERVQQSLDDAMNARDMKKAKDKFEELVDERYFDSK